MSPLFLQRGPVGLILQAVKSTSICTYGTRSLTKAYKKEQPIKHDVTYHIKTTCPSVSSHTCRLPPEQLRIAHQEFDHMTQRNHMSFIKQVVITLAHGTRESPW